MDSLSKYMQPQRERSPWTFCHGTHRSRALQWQSVAPENPAVEKTPALRRTVHSLPAPAGSPAVRGRGPGGTHQRQPVLRPPAPARAVRVLVEEDVRAALALGADADAQVRPARLPAARAPRRPHEVREARDGRGRGVRAAAVAVRGGRRRRLRARRAHGEAVELVGVVVVLAGERGRRVGRGVGGAVRVGAGEGQGAVRALPQVDGVGVQQGREVDLRGAPGRV